MIEKNLHQMWIGNKSLPTEFLHYKNEWFRLHPDYNYKLWDNDAINEILDGLPFKEYIIGNYKESFKSDLLRFWILQHFGGFYIDIDHEPFKKIPDEYLNYDFIIAKFPIDGFTLGTSFIGSRKNGEQVTMINQKTLSHICKLDINSTDLNFVLGPSYITSLLLQDNLLDDSTKVLDAKFIYPYGWYEMNRKHENFKETCPDAITAHHWFYSWGPDQTA